MVGIVIVSHSHAIAGGVAELASEMGGPEVRIETAGGLSLPGHPIGTDAVLVMEAIERAWSDDGVLVLMDLGSAVLSAEMALDLLPEDRRERILLCEAPLVEGAVSAAVTAKVGAPLARVAEEARGGLAGKIAHLNAGEFRSTGAGPSEPTGEPRSVRLTVTAPHGLHARPAARLVQTASAFDARVAVQDLTNGRGPADAASLNAIATLGATVGHEIEVVAFGREAGEALAAIEALAARSFDDPPEPEPGAIAGSFPTGDARGDGVLRGRPASPGIAVGPARRLHTVPLSVPEVGGGDPSEEAAALDAALAAARADVEGQREAVAARAGRTEAEIFDAHQLLLRDEALLGPARRTILDGTPAARAWADVVERTAADWEALEDPYQRARAEDLRSVGRQVLARLLGVELPPPHLEGSGILVGTDLSPAEAVGLDPASALGILTVAGGTTSHAAILARSFGIPAVVGAGDGVLAIEEGTPIAIDGSAGTVYVRPDAARLAELERARDARATAIAEAGRSAGEPATTSDGIRIEVAANISSSAEAVAAVAAGADAVGLFRTEFLFIGRAKMPDEDEQETAYREAAVALDGRPLVIRTLDIGADKPVPYLAQPPEPNPFLGVRGIRLGLERPELLRTQLRAVLRVAREHPIRLMFPMVATIDELRAALSALARAGDRPDSLEVGVMVEVPAAALVAETLADEADFFSIGTNDLTQYTLAADRGNDRVGALADALHPAVLRLIARTVEAAEPRGRWVGVCGELGGDPEATPILVGLGVRELSMGAPAIALVKQAVRRTDANEARELAEQALARATANDVRELLRSRWSG